MTVGHFEKDSQSRLLAVKEHLQSGTYQPKPVKRVYIPNPGSAEKSPLGISTVTDRVVQAAEKAMATLREWSAQAGLELHPQKTRVVDMGQPQAHFDFLGYRFWRGRTSGRIRRFIRPKSMKEMREAIKPITRRSSGQSMSATAQRLKPRLQGFYQLLQTRQFVG